MRVLSVRVVYWISRVVLAKKDDKNYKRESVEWWRSREVI